MNKKPSASSTSMLVLQLISENEQYGYQIIKELEARSCHVFSLKEGTLYPILHALEEEGAVEAFERTAESGKMRKYYRITKKGEKLLNEKKNEWNRYRKAVNLVIREG